MTKREFLDTVFALAPNEANAIMDAFDEYVNSNEPHWIPVTEKTLPDKNRVVVVCGEKGIAWIVGTALKGFGHDGLTCHLSPKDVRKTGRHFDIDKILEEMKE